MKARLKKKIADECKRYEYAIIDAKSEYCSGGDIVYGSRLLCDFYIKKTDRLGLFEIYSPERLKGHRVFLDHIDFIPEHSFKEDIFKILEMQ